MRRAIKDIAARSPKDTFSMKNCFGTNKNSVVSQRSDMPFSVAKLHRMITQEKGNKSESGFDQ